MYSFKNLPFKKIEFLSGVPAGNSEQQGRSENCSGGILEAAGSANWTSSCASHDEVEQGRRHWDNAGEKWAQSKRTDRHRKEENHRTRGGNPLLSISHYFNYIIFKHLLLFFPFLKKYLTQWSFSSTSFMKQDPFISCSVEFLNSLQFLLFLEFFC